MADFRERTQLLIGDRALKRIQQCRVFVAGLGGVGGYAVEALVRAGVEQLTLLDADTVSISNINRQLIALHSTVGRKKTQLTRERVLDINPDCKVILKEAFVTKAIMPAILDEDYDVIVDAIDVFNCKLAFLRYAYHRTARLYSSMGAGNRIDPSSIKTGDLFQSRHCRLAKVLRKKLRSSGISSGIKAVWSEELARAPGLLEEEGNRRTINASISTIPGIFGLTLAGMVLEDLIRSKG